MFKREVRYVKHTHPTKSTAWKQEKYWGQLNPKRKDNWVFGDKQTGAYLLKFSWFPIERHILIKGNASQDDPALREYWELRRNREFKILPSRHWRVAKNQKCVCPLCGQSLLNGEEIQVHHKLPQEHPKREEESNKVLVHLYCQQQIHSGKIQPKDATGQPLLILDHEEEE